MVNLCAHWCNAGDELTGKQDWRNYLLPRPLIAIGYGMKALFPSGTTHPYGAWLQCQMRLSLNAEIKLVNKITIKKVN